MGILCRGGLWGVAHEGRVLAIPAKEGGSGDLGKGEAIAWLSVKGVDSWGFFEDNDVCKGVAGCWGSEVRGLDSGDC